MSGSVHKAGILILVFLTGGQAQLEENGKVVWHSDNDADFREVVPDEFLGEKNAQEILEYLADEGIIDEDDLESVEIEVESLDSENDDEFEDDEDEPELSS
jgi:hypothetical protein